MPQLAEKEDASAAQKIKNLTAQMKKVKAVSSKAQKFSENYENLGGIPDSDEAMIFENLNEFEDANN